jgi:hypothetical protein
MAAQVASAPSTAQSGGRWSAVRRVMREERMYTMIAFRIKPSNDGPDRAGKGGRVDTSQFEVDTPHGYR